MRTRRLLEEVFSNVRCLINKNFRLESLIKSNSGLHVGCGDIRLTNFINLDVRATKATDIAQNSTKLTIFPNKSFQTVFSNAFFEHLYKDQRIPHLTDAKRTLKPNGILIYLGMPDFRIVADSYLKRTPGILYKKFDVNEAYRYTHGNPEQADGWWQEQLHKSLFDEDSLSEMVTKAGFDHFLIFNYSFRDEHLALNLGVIGFNKKPSFALNVKWVEEFARKYSTDVAVGSVEIIVKK